MQHSSKLQEGSLAVRQTLDDYTIAACARDYLDARNNGVTNAHQQVADDRGKSSSTITAWLRHARARGILTPYVPGESWGELTPKAKAILDGTPPRTTQQAVISSLVNATAARQKADEITERAENMTRDAISRALEANVPVTTISEITGLSRSVLYSRYRDIVVPN